MRGAKKTVFRIHAGTHACVVCIAYYATRSPNTDMQCILCTYCSKGSQNSLFGDLMGDQCTRGTNGTSGDLTKFRRDFQFSNQIILRLDLCVECIFSV